MPKVALRARCVRLALVTGFALSAATLPDGTEAAPAGEPSGSTGPAYTGAGSCGSSQCHGAPRPRTQLRVRQDEATIWASKDRHAQAWRVLQDERSVRIARNLRLAKPAAETERCLNCHALNVPAARRGAAFELSDGVSCEGCHGPAEKWLGSHTARDWSHRQSLAAGMYDTKNVVLRATRCLACHLGEAGNTVDHELIAAGHPDLYFELDAFSAGMPAHWNESAEKGTWFGVRAWAVGQAVGLREAMRRLETATSGDSAWPEFSEFECFACHHDLDRESKDSWRQQHGYTGTPGRPRWNDARLAVLRVLLRQAAASEAQTIEADLRTLGDLMASGGKEKNAIAQVAGRIRGALDPVIARLAEGGGPENPDAARTLIDAIASSSDELAYAGYGVATQAYLAVDALYRPLARSAKPSNDAALRDAIVRLLKDLEDFSCREPRKGGAAAGSGGKTPQPCPPPPSSAGSCYDPRTFAAHLATLGKLLK